MRSLTYHNPIRILFGDHTLDQLSDLLREFYVSNLLLVYSGDFVKELGIWDVVRKARVQNGTAFYEEGGVVPDPKIEFVRELITLGKGKRVDFVLTVGGGSSIDIIKAVAAGTPYEHDVQNFFEYVVVPEMAVPVSVVTTIPASSSECLNCSITSNGLHECGIECNCIIPKFAVMNSGYTRTLSVYQTSTGIAGTLSHTLERYFTNMEHVGTTDYTLEGVMQAPMVNARRLMKKSDDIYMHSEVQCLAFIAHDNLLDIGRESDWGAYHIEHELSVRYGAMHEEGTAVVTIAWIRYVAAHHPDKLAQLASRIFGIDSFVYIKEDMAYILTGRLEELFRSLHLKTALYEMGINDARFEEMVSRATNNSKDCVGYYVALNKQIFVDVLKMTLWKSFVIMNTDS